MSHAASKVLVRSQRQSYQQTNRSYHSYFHFMPFSPSSHARLEDILRLTAPFNMFPTK